MSGDWRTDQSMAGADGAGTHQRERLDRFLQSVERQAFRMALLGVSDEQEALDIVQDVMLAFVRRYGRKPADEWAPLFFRCLENRIRDWYRRSSVRRRWMVWLDRPDQPAAAERFGSEEPRPADAMSHDEFGVALEEALRSLPHRQRQAFLYRIWQGLSGSETALAMGCSEGSVKTHLFRALAALRERLEAFEP
ncbi:MAG: RNA polymerase sigma factor [Xanthomonadales bacterium]|nr:RNA polymerase sigma factor [Xanthomonadales bacterium]